MSKTLSIVLSICLASSSLFAAASNSKSENKDASTSNSKSKSNSSSTHSSESSSASNEKSQSKDNSKSTSESTTQSNNKESSKSASISLSINPIPVVIDELLKYTPDEVYNWPVLGQKDLGVAYSDVVNGRVVYIDTLKRTIYEDKAKSYEAVDAVTFDKLQTYIPLLYKMGEISSYAIKKTQATKPYGFGYQPVLRKNVVLAIQEAEKMKIADDLVLKKCWYQGDLNNYACDTNKGKFQLKIQTEGTLPVLLYHSDPYFSASTMANQKVNMEVSFSESLTDSLAKAVETSTSSSVTNSLRAAQSKMRESGKSVEARKAAEAALSYAISQSSNTAVDSAVQRTVNGGEGPVGLPSLIH